MVHFVRFSNTITPPAESAADRSGSPAVEDCPWRFCVNTWPTPGPAPSTNGRHEGSFPGAQE
jgi:hypothetical protein